MMSLGSQSRLTKRSLSRQSRQSRRRRQGPKPRHASDLPAGRRRRRRRRRQVRHCVHRRQALSNCRLRWQRRGAPVKASATLAAVTRLERRLPALPRRLAVQLALTRLRTVPGRMPLQPPLAVAAVPRLAMLGVPEPAQRRTCQSAHEKGQRLQWTLTTATSS